MSSLSCKFKDWADASVYRTVADSYSQSEVDEMIPSVEGYALSSNVYNISAVDEALALKMDASAAGTFAPKSTTYTKTEVNDALALKQDVADMSDYATTSSIEGKLDISDLDSEIVLLNKYQIKSELDSDVTTLQYLKSAGVLSAVAGDGYLKSAGVLSAVAGDGYLKSAGVLSAVAGDGFIKADNSSITEKAVASAVFAKSNSDLNKLFRALQASLELADPDTPANPFDWSALIPVV